MLRTIAKSLLDFSFLTAALCANLIASLSYSLLYSL